MRKTKAKALFAGVIMAVMVLGLVACGGSQNDSDSAVGSAGSEEAQQTAGGVTAGNNTIDSEYARAAQGDSLIAAFIGEGFYDGTIKDEDDAIDAIESVQDRIGADDSTVLDPVAVRPTEDGTTYYIFRQLAGDMYVHGACVKLVVDANGKATGLISGILPNVAIEPLDKWNTTQEQAEQAVRDYCAEEGVEDVEILSDATEHAVIPLADGRELYRYAWAIYTVNYNDDPHMPYLVHYVSEDGQYLYNLGISEPHNADAQSGDAAAFAFDKMKADTWSGTVDLVNGGTKDVTVPVMVNPDSGSVILGDQERKILCADYADFTFSDTISPTTETDQGFPSYQLAVYDTFIRVWDFYDSIGWTGPDGDGTPTMLMMDIVEENGETIDNAFYAGRKWGFQTFGFSDANAAGESIDVIGHEFTHCVTGTTMTTNLYLNDYGSINEAMSDIMGNLIEIEISGNDDGAWTHGENMGPGQPTRSLSNPHESKQPSYVWDAYYVPPVAVGTTLNDQGGVHINMSLLSTISYGLDQAGMSPDDQVFFWMNVALAMTPATDYEQMAELLPWCMKQAGYPQYVDAVNKAVEQAGYKNQDKSDALPDGCGLVALPFPNEELAAEGDVRMSLYPVDGSSIIITYPGIGTSQIEARVPEGDYAVEIWCARGKLEKVLYLNGDSWEEYESYEWLKDKDALSEVAIHVKSGEAVELPTQGLDV